MAAYPLQIEHDAGEFRGCDFCAFAKLARLKVLTKYASQIAPGEKDCARTIPAAQTIFLAKVWEGARHPRKPTALTYADLVVEAVDLAITRANATRPQRFYRSSSAFLKNSLFESLQVRWKIFA
jgi:hypothetical protein